MIKGFFVTGTDTDIGKTYVCRQLADAFAQFLPVTYAKPIQTGCEKAGDGALRSPDFDYVMAGEARMTASYDEHVPYRFEPACSPHLAAQIADEQIQIPLIAQSMEIVSRGVDCTIVEGAGGILVPLNQNQYMLDLMNVIKLPVILVTSPRLGTLNHTFLSYQSLRRNQITVAAVVFNEPVAAEHDFIFEDNRVTIERTIAPTPLFSIAYGDCFSPKLVEFCHDLAQRFL
ncbi:MAG: dethiobiotin synthase [Chitinivibrionales bacterium]